VYGVGLRMVWGVRMGFEDRQAQVKVIDNDLKA
jgi:hypothetical protein